MVLTQSPDPSLTDWMIAVRRHLHRYPELSFAEHRTCEYIEARLDELGIAHRRAAKTGVIAWLGEPRPSGRSIALRADLDALPIAEKTGLPFASRHKGVMHACGHDGHVAMLLGAAALLRQHPPAGRVTLLFQPAEEGGGGARAMIADGALEGVTAIFAGHIDRHYPAGRIAVQPGLICAFTDEFKVAIRGHGGHAAKPHETVDSIVAASLLVMSLQTLVSREINPAYPSVVTVGKISGGSAPNVIAEEALLEGTIRTTHPEVRQTIITGLKRMVKAVETLHNAKTRFQLKEGYPPVINDPAASDLARQAAIRVVGHEGVLGLPHPSMGGEDFSYYLEKVPGCLVRFGARKPGLENIPAHSPRFDFNEEVLPVGAAFLAEVARLGLERSGAAVRDGDGGQPGTGEGIP